MAMWVIVPLLLLLAHPGTSLDDLALDWLLELSGGSVDTMYVTDAGVDIKMITLSKASIQKIINVDISISPEQPYLGDDLEDVVFLTCSGGELKGNGSCRNFAMTFPSIHDFSIHVHVLHIKFAADDLFGPEIGNISAQLVAEPVDTGDLVLDTQDVVLVDTRSKQYAAQMDDVARVHIIHASILCRAVCEIH